MAPKKMKKIDAKEVDIHVSENNVVLETTSANNNIQDVSDVVEDNTVKPVKTIRKKPTKPRKNGNRTPSSYVLFSMDYRKEVSANFPDLNLGDVSKKCGEAWSALSSDKKEEWKMKAEALKLEKKAETPQVQDPEKKKRKPSSYLMFSIDYRKKVIAENPNLTLGDVSKKCGEFWKTMSEEDKEVWKQKAAAA